MKLLNIPAQIQCLPETKATIETVAENFWYCYRKYKAGTVHRCASKKKFVHRLSALLAEGIAGQINAIYFRGKKNPVSPFS